MVYDANEKCKVWGHKLESELKSAIVARLAELKRLRGVGVRSLTLLPVPISEYLRRMQKALDTNDNNLAQLPAPDEEEDS